MPATARRDSLIDLVKALASQLIVLHHLALYGPMADAIFPAIGGVFHWIRDYALMAVQSFLVVGGYLSARSHAHDAGNLRIPALLWRRYLRLMQPYAVALALAIVGAALARLLIQHADTPATPSPAQLVAHLLLLQDIVGVPSLSLGVWYIAIDFQLYALFLVVSQLGRKHAAQWVALLTAASLLWFNRLPNLDMWAPYFFGAYGLGFLAQRVTTAADSRQAQRLLWSMAGLLLLAAIVEWRGRVLVAGITAFLLIAGGQKWAHWHWLRSRPVSWLGQISYAVFLIHYPVALLVGSLVAYGWPHDVAASAAGLGITWLSSLAAGTLLHAAVEKRAGLRALRFSRSVVGTPP